jgi:hypothetical protein
MASRHSELNAQSAHVVCGSQRFADVVERSLSLQSRCAAHLGLVLVACVRSGSFMACSYVLSL